MSNNKIDTIKGSLTFTSISFFIGYVLDVSLFKGLSWICLALAIVNIFDKEDNLRYNPKLKREEYEKEGLKTIMYEGPIQIYVNKQKKQCAVNNYDIYSFKDIISCEILENGEVISSTITKNKMSITKGIAGTALFGPLGGAVGFSKGKSISTSTQKTIGDIKIQINTTDLNNSCILIPLVQSEPTNSNFYKTRKELALKVISIFQIIIDSKD